MNRWLILGTVGLAGLILAGLAFLAIPAGPEPLPPPPGASQEPAAR